MGPYVPHWREVEQTDVMGCPVAEDTTATTPIILYDLVGTINHSGTLYQGHYVSNVKVDGQWYSCNDAEVHRLSEENAEKYVLKSEDAYMLFYIRRK